MAVDGMAELMVLQYVIKVVPVHAMMAYKGSISIAPHILNLGTTVMRMVNVMLRPLSCRERTQVPIQSEAWWVLRACLAVLVFFFNTISCLC